ncbi:MAG: hypothetical protein K0T53_01675 [Wolbachia pipientis]|nr:hypothetical protein [Wolbachia endosymbiont of Dipetalonema caudispina]MCV3769421.1 hypothetical protein [Wolbachia pipientis]
MKVIIVIIMLLFSNYTMASEKISLINKKKLSQGYVAPVIVENNVIMVDKYGALYSFDVDNLRIMNWKLRFSQKKNW